MGGDKGRTKVTAYLLVGILLAAVAIGLGWRVYAQSQTQPDLTIWITRARFQGRDVGRELYGLLEGFQPAGEGTVSVRYVDRGYTSAGEARAEADKRNLSLILWSLDHGSRAELFSEFLHAPMVRFAGQSLVPPQQLVWDLDASDDLASLAQVLRGWIDVALGVEGAGLEAWRGVLASEAGGSPARIATLWAYAAILELGQGGEIEASLGDLEGALALEDDLYEAHYALGIVYGQRCSESGGLDQALYHAQRATDLRPDDPRALAALGDVLARKGAQEEAISAYRQALALDPHALAIWNKLGLAYYARGQEPEAEEAFTTCLARAQSEEGRAQGDSAVYWAELGLAYHYLSLPEQALEAYAMAESLGGGDALLYRRMGDVLVRQDQWDAALDAYEQALTQSPGDVLTHTAMGNLYTRRGQMEEAEAAYLEAVAAQPCQAEPFLALGEIHFGREAYAQAAEYFARGLALEPDDPDAQCALGVSCYLAQQWDKAVSAFEAAARLDPDNVEAFLGLGRIHGQRQEHGAALEAYQRVLDLDPESVNAWIGLGDAHRGLGDFAAAESAYQRAIQLAPEDAQLWLVLGTLYDSQGELDKAIEAYKAALELDKSPLVHAALASAYQRRGNLNLAAGEYELALEGDPDNAEYQVSLALVYIAEDRLIRAHELVSQALETRPDYALAHFMAGLILEKRGEIDGAVAAYEKAAEYGRDDEAIYHNAQAQLERLGKSR